MMVNTKASAATAASPPRMFISGAAALAGYRVMVNHSPILPQCIRAYGGNIGGFGVGVRYRDDREKERPEMRREWDKLASVLEALNTNEGLSEVFVNLVETREMYGVAYLEVLRDAAGDVVGLEGLQDVYNIEKSTPCYTAALDGGRGGYKRFCVYRRRVAGDTVYYKEFGDTRAMDRRTGAFGTAVPPSEQATEIIAFPIGSAPYGEVRWVGQILGADGARAAEALNHRYFKEGRHTPMMLMVNGGTLTEESYEKLEAYMNGIKGARGQHSFIVLEAAEAGGRSALDGERAPSIQIVPMASMLQRDELFQDYQENHRRRVQSAFRLPDVYLGYCADFNRSTAQVAREITEEQVFAPERARLARALNALLAGYNFRYVEAYFKGPQLSNPDDKQKLLEIARRAGGLTPNKAKELVYAVMGGVAEPFEGAWGDVPLEKR